MLTFPNLVYTDGDHDTAAAVSLPRFSAPLPGVNVDYLLTQDFQIDINSYAKLALNTPHDDFPDYVLVSESEAMDIGGGDVRWTRTYAKVPDTYTEPDGNFSYHFPGFYLASDFSQRQPFSRNSPVQVTREFFLVGSGQTYATSEEIPSVPQQRYYLASVNEDVDYVADSPPRVEATVPDRTEYEAMMAADAAAADSFSIVPEPASPRRWMGNIFILETRRIKAL